MCKQLGPVRVRRSNYPSLLLTLFKNEPMSESEVLGRQRLASQPVSLSVCQSVRECVSTSCLTEVNKPF